VEEARALKPLAYRFTLTERDLVDAARLSARPMFRLVAVLGAILFVGGLVLFLVRPDSSAGLAAVIAGPIAILAARVGYVSPWAVRRRAGTLIGAECELIVAEDGLHFTQPGISGTIEWSALTGTKEDGRMLFFMQGGVHRFGLPKRAVGVPEDLGRLRELVQERIAAAGPSPRHPVPSRRDRHRDAER
jgi:hypothetical protein